MAFVLNTQRRGLEEAIGTKYVDLHKPRRYYLKQKYYGETEIFFWGVSDGVGTCADLHGIDIAVFGYENPGDPPPCRPEKEVWFSTLVRPPTYSEKKLGGSDPMRIVEALKPVRVTDEMIVFEQNGGVAVYVPLA